jgi:hypothetical protein
MFRESGALTLRKHVKRTIMFLRPIPVDARSKASVCDLSLAGVRIPPGIWMSLYCECCLLSGRGLCDGLITRPEESYRVRVSLSVIRRNNNPLYLQ